MNANSRKSSRRSCVERSLLFLVALSLLPAACQTTNSSPTIDRHQPEEVLRAYFDAWTRNDTARQESFMTADHGGLVREPVDSLRVVSVKPVDGAPATSRVYAVTFEIKPSGPGSSVDSGSHNWTYTLIWDAQRESWLISNYGAG